MAQKQKEQIKTRQDGGRVRRLTHRFPAVKDDDLAVLVVDRHRALVALTCERELGQCRVNMSWISLPTIKNM